MSKHLDGKVIAIAGARKAEEMINLVQKLGGNAVIRPAQGTVFLDDENLKNGITAMIDNPPDWVLLTTGMGFEAILNVAEEIGKKEALLALIQQTPIAARGYKTVNALRKIGVTPVVKDDDGMTSGLIRGLSAHDLKGKRVIVQLHGDPAPKLIAWLNEQDAVVEQLLPYRHIAPEEEHLQLLLDEIMNGQIDAVAFTSAPQVRFLLQYASEQGQLERLLKAFEENVIAAAVGTVTAQPLIEENVQRIVIPEVERMGSLIVELGKYIAGSNQEAAEK